MIVWSASTPKTPCIFPDGTQVLASGWLQRKVGEPAPDFGLYLDPQWAPTWPAVMLDWPDFGVPRDRDVADARDTRRVRAGSRRADESKSPALAVTDARAPSWRAWQFWPACRPTRLSSGCARRTAAAPFRSRHNSTGSSAIRSDLPAQTENSGRRSRVRLISKKPSVPDDQDDAVPQFGGCLTARHRRHHGPEERRVVDADDRRPDFEADALDPVLVAGAQRLVKFGRGHRVGQVSWQLDLLQGGLHGGAFDGRFGEVKAVAQGGVERQQNLVAVTLLSRNQYPHRPPCDVHALAVVLG